MSKTTKATMAAAAAAAILLSGTAVEAKKVSLHFTFWGPNTVMKAYQRARDDFRRIHPDVEIKLSQLDPNIPPYFEKVTTMFAAGTAPDIVWTEAEAGVYRDWVRSGLLIPLDPFIKSDNLNVNTLFHPNVLKAQRYDGKTFGKRGQIYGLPKGWNTDGLWYHKDLLAKAGMVAPTDKWTWTDLLEAAKKLTRMNADGSVAQIGMADQGMTSMAWNYILQNGGDIEDDNGNFTLDSKEVVDALQFWGDFSAKHHVAPWPGVKGLTYGEWPSNVMGKDKAAMGIGPTWYMLAWVGKKNAADIFASAPLPNGKRNAAVMYTGGISITKQCKNKQDAWEFVKFLATHQGANLDLGASLNEWPPSLAVCKSQEMLKPAVLRIDRTSFISQLDYAELQPATSRKTKRVEDLYMPVFNQVKEGKTTAAAAIPIVAKQIKALLAGK